MEYKEEFETRKDVFRVDVFHNKKNGEKVTMYFVPRTTPVNEDTVFDYCTKNKTWREKQAQQWCDEKGGKNKDKLKTLPYVAGGLQRDLKWFGDKATAVFEDYKKGLGMTVQPRSNNQTGENQGFQDRLKSLVSLGEKEIVQKFNELFKAGGDNWHTSDAGHNAYGEALMNAELTVKGKDGQTKTYKTKAGSGIEPAVGKRAAQRNVILAFLAEEYGIGQKKEKPRADLEGFKNNLRENILNVYNFPSVVIGMAEKYGLEAYYTNFDPRDKIGKYQVNSISLHIGDGKSFPHTGKGYGQSKKDAEEAAALKAVEELCNLDIEKAVINELNEDDLKYLRVLNDREDAHIERNEFFGRNYRVTKDGYSFLLFEVNDPREIMLNEYIKPKILDKVIVSDEERKSINKIIDRDIQDRYTELEKEEQERQAEEKREVEERIKKAKLAELEKRTENSGLNFKLEEAVRANDLEEVKSLIAQGAQISNKDVYDNTLNIALCSEEINQDMINYLMDNGAETEFPEYHSFDGDLVTTKSLLCEKITDLEAAAVRALVIGGADVWFDAHKQINGERPYANGFSIWDALEEVERKKNSCEEYYEEDTEEYKNAVEILKIIEDAREGRLKIHEADKTEQQNQETKADEQKQTEQLEVKEDENAGTPLPTISDDKGMVHLAPQDKVKPEAVHTLTLFDKNGKETVIKAAFVSDNMRPVPNARITTENPEQAEGYVVLVPYTRAKEAVKAMEEHGVPEAKGLGMQLNVWKNMGAKSPVTGSYGQPTTIKNSLSR